MARRALDRTSPLPLWAQILDDLKARLATGEFDQGFPPERELIAEYGVSRHTVRDAMTRLRQAGVISRERGRGTFLRRDTIEQPLGALYSLFRSVEAQGFVQTSRVLELQVTTNAAVAPRLSLPAYASLVYLHRVRHADRVPIATDEAWLPLQFGQCLLGADFEHTALYTELERCSGVRPTAGWERVSPILPSPAERSLLHVASRQPAFLVERFTESDGRPLEWRRTVVRGDHYAFLTTWSTSEGDSSPVVVSTLETA